MLTSVSQLQNHSITDTRHQFLDNMHFSALVSHALYIKRIIILTLLQTLPLMAMVAAVQGASVKVYEDAKCTKLIQTINYNPADYYQCVNFNSNFAQAVIMSTDMAAKGFNAWDRQFCAGNQAGGYVFTHRRAQP